MSIPPHIQTVLSRLHDARSEPEGDHATDLASCTWPSSVAEHSNASSECMSSGHRQWHTSLRPRRRSQIQIVESKLAVARKLPHGDQATAESDRRDDWHVIPHTLSDGPLVGAVEHNLAYPGRAFESPNANGSVGRARGEVAAGRAPGDIPHHVLVPCVA